MSEYEMNLIQEGFILMMSVTVRNSAAGVLWVIHMSITGYKALMALNSTLFMSENNLGV